VGDDTFLLVGDGPYLNRGYETIIRGMVRFTLNQYSNSTNRRDTTMVAKKQYKIGVMTHWWTQTNYGQLLQAYAMQVHLKKLGHDAYIIRYRPRSKRQVSKFRRLLRLRTWKNRIKRYTSRYGDKSRLRLFDSFRNQYLKHSDEVYLSYKQLKKSPPEADIYIVGSDQVWGPWFQLDPYFLSFIPDNAFSKIAYAASFGRESLTSDEISRYAPQIAKFAAVGVREETALPLCRQLGINDAQWVPDPTILLDREEWLRISQPSDCFTSGYKNVFAYVIGPEDHSTIHRTLDVVSRKGSTVYVSQGDDSRSNLYPTIQQWIWLIANADMVVTNSFHGTVFCLLFNRQFITIPREGVLSSMNTRVKTLLDKVGLGERLLDLCDAKEINRLELTEVNWIAVNRIMGDWKCDGKDFLNRVIEECRSGQ